MASEAQIMANRANAQKSTGPRTPEGKETASQNALKHGLLARAAVLQGEDWEEYTCFHENMIEELYPDGMQEQELAERGGGTESKRRADSGFRLRKTRLRR